MLHLEDMGMLWAEGTITTLARIKLCRLRWPCLLIMIDRYTITMMCT